MVKAAAQSVVGPPERSFQELPSPAKRQKTPDGTPPERPARRLPTDGAGATDGALHGAAHGAPHGAASRSAKQLQVEQRSGALYGAAKPPRLQPGTELCPEQRKEQRKNLVRIQKNSTAITGSSRIG
jgi:hypothetical protein